MLTAPLPGIFSKLSTLDIDSNVYSYDSVDVYTKANAIVARRIKSSLCEKFELSESETEVLYLNGEIFVKAQKKIGLFESDLKHYIYNSYGIEAEVELYEQR